MSDTKAKYSDAHTTKSLKHVVEQWEALVEKQDDVRRGKLCRFLIELLGEVQK
jgi:hypothetical protein